MNTSLPAVLAHGVDTLYLNVVPCDKTLSRLKQELNQELQGELEAYKALAQEKEEAVPTRWVFEGEQLFMKDKGARGGAFPWVLECPKLIVCIGRGKRTGIVGQARLSSEYLWFRRDVGAAISSVHVFLTEIYGQNILLDLSSIDLTVDFTGWDVGTLNWKEHFVRRAQKDSEFPTLPADSMVNGPEQPFNRWHRLTGMVFGRHSSPLYCRLYDKTHEIRYQSPEKVWMHAIWAERTDQAGQRLWDGKSDVWRLEISIKREVLGQFSLGGKHPIDDAYSVLEHLERIWGYCVGHPNGGEDGLPDGWIRYVIPTGDTNRSRWPVHPAWQMLQQAFVEAPLPESAYQQEQREQEELLQQADEYLATHPWRVQRDHKKKRSSDTAPTAKKVEPPAGVDMGYFMRECKRKVDMDRAIASAAGWTSTIEAWRYKPNQQEEEAEHDISETFHFIYEQVEQYLAEKRRDYSDMVHKKRVLYRLETATA